MYSKLNKWILYAILLLILPVSVLAICCPDDPNTCHQDGTCFDHDDDTNTPDTWCRGCTDGSTTFADGAVLGNLEPCLVCDCQQDVQGDYSICEWKPRNDLCPDLDGDEVCVCSKDYSNYFLCDDGVFDTGNVLDSECRDRDLDEYYCEGGCGDAYAWEGSAGCCIGDDGPADSCSFSETCLDRNYEQNPNCKLKITGNVVSATDNMAIPDGAEITLRGQTDDDGATEDELLFRGRSASLAASGGSTYTEDQDTGYFEIEDVWKRSDYDIVIAARWYTPIVIHKHIGAVEFDTLDLGLIELKNAHEGCRPDCTKEGTVWCAAECDVHPACEYYDNYVKDVICNERRPGQYHEYDAEQAYNYNPYTMLYDTEHPELTPEYVVRCCMGMPVVKGDVEVAGVALGNKDVVRTTRFIWYGGRPVKLIVDAFG